MKEIKHEIIHHNQITATSCTPSAVATLLSHYGNDISEDELMKVVPTVKDENGEGHGSINQQYAQWLAEQGYKTTIYSADVQVLDLSWMKLGSEEVVTRLKKRVGGYEVPSLERFFTDAYTQSYIDFIESGGQLKIVPYISSDLLYKLLKKGPVLPAVCYSTLHGTGRSKLENGAFVKNDIDGRAPNHTIVIYGHNEKGEFYVSDPDMKPGLHVINSEQMVAAIATAQIECDNLVVQISKK